MTILFGLIRKIINKTKRIKNTILRLFGTKIGKNTVINCRLKSFGSEPYLVSIGNNCVISKNVEFITHHGVGTLLYNLKYFDKKIDIIEPINIGNNVYIGMGAYIMPGVTIGDNWIIGARSIVTKNIPDSSVVTGSPARIIENINSYYQKVFSRGNFEYTTNL